MTAKRKSRSAAKRKPARKLAAASHVNDPRALFCSAPVRKDAARSGLKPSGRRRAASGLVRSPLWPANSRRRSQLTKQEAKS